MNLFSLPPLSPPSFSLSLFHPLNEMSRSLALARCRRWPRHMRHDAVTKKLSIDFLIDTLDCDQRYVNILWYGESIKLIQFPAPEPARIPFPRKGLLFNR